MFKNLFSFVELLETEPELFMFGDVKFSRDFGPWKKGDVVDCLCFDTEKGEAYSSDENGDDIDRCQFQLTAII
jgi:hypothetical protein